MNKKPAMSGKRPVSADSRKSPQEQQRMKTPSAPNTPKAPAAPNNQNTARQIAASQQKKRKSSKSALKKSVKAPTKTSAKASVKTPAKKPAASGQPQAARPAPPTARGTAVRSPQKPRVQSSPRKRHKYRGGNYILYYMLAGVVVITVLVILANTVLFRCRQITVSGNVRYSAEEIAESSGIVTGKNLLHINARQAADSIVSSLAYVDDAQVKKSFPTGINITVTEAEKWFCVRHGNTTAAVSRRGKIIEHCAPDGLTVITGYEPENIDVGKWLRSETDSKTDIPGTILGAIERTSLENVDEVDLNDRFSIKMSIDNGRIILELGTVSEMESKLIVANDLIRNHISATESVTVLLSNPIQATVHRNIDAEPENPVSEPSNSDEPGDSDASSEPQT
ncbi:MAG: FtsQ-type POTRA domain-containing protein [Oscillospiraceae bacterium]|nr:FtsQ-type POTRA domain-containing protein [Oscillospiraceae bacterium]